MWNKLFGPFEMKCSSLKWNYFELLRIGFFLSLWDGHLNSTSLSLVAGIYWKVVVSCPFLPDTAVKQKCLKCRLVAVTAKRGSHFRKEERDLWGDPCQDQTGRRSSWGHASTDGHRMVIPAFCRPVASCCSYEHPPWVVLLQVRLFALFLCVYWYNSSNESEVTPVLRLSAGNQRLVCLLPVQ